MRPASSASRVTSGRIAAGDDPTIPSVMSMVVHDGRLYAGTGAWDWIRAFGQVKDQLPPLDPCVRLQGDRTWENLGEVGKGSRVLCLASFKGAFAGLDRVGGGRLFRRDGDAADWWARSTAATSKTSWSGMGPHVATMATCIGTRLMTSSPVSARRRTESRRSTHCTCGLGSSRGPGRKVMYCALREANAGTSWDACLPVGQSEINETTILKFTTDRYSPVSCHCGTLSVREGRPRIGFVSSVAAPISRRRAWIRGCG